ncbi:bifunctional hydroxymethylpyrimidine kinase/phosphomethylpyrimidine kinase [Levilactobacillus angrenensis]|uniref:Hydroxymethylpyrimidine/phosphomethylpyrimidine kinase n=1 Tax=Levilactobacillus angrenensis TaxID=2486020 RepID=A0ABW1U9Z6_9LACO|nr:bifunctional hydroxymethylpyrimidine kinase/phosphomethylpyrimidine kinase [Levilactobacillus angrenensis]
METVLTIAGSDSLAGGGLQADLKTFEELNVFGVSAITSLINVDPTGIQSHVLSADLLSEQLDSTLSQLPIRFAKIGLIGNFSNLLVIIKKLMNTDIKLIVDPVLFFKEGAHYFQKVYTDAMKSLLLPVAYLVTPNLEEAAFLSNVSKLETKDDVQQAAQKIQALGCPNVVIKCGSRFPGDTAYNYLLTESGEHWFETPKLAVTTTDGAGCTFSAAITALLARNYALVDAVQLATRFVYLGIQAGIPISPHLGSVWQGAYRQKEVHP